MHCCTPRLSGADESEHPKPGERVICTLLPDYKQKSIKHHKIQVFGKRCSCCGRFSGGDPVLVMFDKEEEEERETERLQGGGSSQLLLLLLLLLLCFCYFSCVSEL